MRHIRFAATTVLAVSALSACATKGFVRRGLEEQRVALGAERTERVSADDAIRSSVRGSVDSLRSDVTGLRTDLNALKSDLQVLRNEYGAKISALEGAVKFALPVHFAFDDAAVRQEDQAALEKFAQVARQYYPGATITVEGFADPAGSVAYNLRLSRERADAVRDFLVAQGLDGSQLRTVGYGKDRLVRPGAKGSDTGAELNRRVSFVIETPEADATIAVMSGSGN